jgi:Mlc titration factor MtfA (ptsG expression regulator)
LIQKNEKIYELYEKTVNKLCTIAPIAQYCYIISTLLQINKHHRSNKVNNIFLLFILCTIILIITIWVIKNQLRNAKRKKLLTTDIPPAWVNILENTLFPYTHLSANEKQRLHGTINVFLDEKRFEGCGGLEITEEIRVTIAAQACMLLLNRPIGVYPRLQTILVYPSTYVAGEKGMFGSGEPESVRLGESWQSGVVVLAWNSVKGGAANFHDGHNVTIHEFAHQLDQDGGAADGAPVLEDRSAYRTWAHIFSNEYADFKDETEHGHRTCIDQYGATNPAEFFAVATETFFEKPEQLHQKRPELYKELKMYYHIDPLKWE